MKISKQENEKRDNETVKCPYCGAEWDDEDTERYIPGESCPYCDGW